MLVFSKSEQISESATSVAHNKISRELDRIYLHLPHSCIIIAETISKLDREAGGGFSCQSKTIGGIHGSYVNLSVFYRTYLVFSD
jgi:hypothetical protein